MGWSCAAAAHKQLDKVIKLCRANGGSYNEWLFQAREFLYELGAEQTDGAIVGHIYEHKLGRGVLVGVFRIEATGAVTAFPFVPPAFFQ